jgi:hypothetical protein
MQNISRNYKSSSIDVTFKWENISKEKLYTALGEINLRGEIILLLDSSCFSDFKRFQYCFGSESLSVDNLSNISSLKS